MSRDTIAGPTSEFRVVARNTALQAGGRMYALCVSLIGISMVSRYLGVEGFGELNVATVYTALFLVVADAGLNTVTVRRLSFNKEIEESVFPGMLGLRAVLSLLAMMLAASTVWLLPYPRSVKLVSMVLSTTIAFGGMTTSLLTVLQARLDFRLPALLDAVSKSAITAGYLLVAVFTASRTAGHQERLLLAAAVTSVASAVGLAVTSRYLRRRGVVITLRYQRAVWRSIGAESLPLAAVAVLGLVNYRIDTLLLSFLKRSHDVGIYSMAYRPLEMTLPFAGFFIATVFPVLSRPESREPGRAAVLARRGFEFLLALSVPCAVAAWFAAPVVIRILGGSGYGPAVVPLRILVISFPFTFVTMFAVQVLIANQLQRRLLGLAVFGVTLNFVLNVVFVPEYSYRASAMATLFSEVVGTIIALHLLRRWLRIGLDWHGVAAVVLSGGGMLATVVTVARFNVLGALAIGGGVYLVMLIRLGRLKVSDFARILERS